MVDDKKLIDYNLNIKQIRDSIKKITSSNNIKKWDLGAMASENHSVQVDKGIAKQLKGSQKSSLTIRVWNKNNQIGITSTSDYSEIGLEKAFMHAYQASDFGNKRETPTFSPLAKSKLEETSDSLQGSLGISTMLEILKSAESDLISRDLPG